MITVNKIKGSSKAFGDIPASLTTLIDLGTVNTYNHLMIVNNLNADIILKIGDNEVTFTTNKDFVIDNMPYNGIIQYKYVSAPTSGSLAVMYF
jgi:hypothetical protein